MYEHLAVSSRFGVSEECAITCEVAGSGVAWVEFGTPGAGLEVEFDSAALRRFVELGTSALPDTDERSADEQVEPRRG
ncbi:MAG TPA: hypothetical protein VGG05_12255 [Pseudonocardiaceae bacterium]